MKDIDLHSIKRNDLICIEENEALRFYRFYWRFQTTSFHQKVK